ncbi:hypothetical protein [Guptibacillus hwajinpoensis]|uniref:Uncharacterized protein n=2 Tax=Guptibacillus hwajinpoensis TaxID=208199 RepID=A0A0J6CTM5_9BACL|nr:MULTISPECIES: hypothetical protein [Alkalihalobacillus]KMM36548.1 hypothetical protein AB986_11290 [Alkalihalobacillus macyae]MDP4551438.1 hypothetical protein [Alkalihalobacillus macyae]MDQ0482215.1 hypothetical protein [Alkalihalobacillus hemicentroti]
MPEQFPIFYPAEADSIKNAHDSYNVYVNDDYVGNKILFSHCEKIEDLSDYLNNKGFYNFQAEVEGDHYRLQMTEQDQGEVVKDELHNYLHLR